ncbi:50S ribosomal protein L11 methyltransferase [Synechococcus sp. A10-1-5-1]|uniref:50S ribosomal protein L11 methyltransferase n=1 Tax=Synechococcus sp. A10-1-5-1 TaxID=2936507 RepID=UPI0020013CED|nr:50S ribosomal protein L11 methyltransferase [Synechococcus sp. A10-1-5-1]UPM49857.1 50S ribosomal protein L11 methyltransferase [Synechococcus sp. A10-1-5-1]
MALPWWRLELLALPELEESLIWKLNTLGIPRVAVRHRPEHPQERQLVAWLPASDWPESERQQLEQALQPLADTFGLTLPPIHWFEQDDEDWSLSWKQHWEPDPVGQRLLILPAWLELPPEYADRQVIRMDPGSAFGTGSHPTTRLCLEAIEQLADERGGTLSPMRVADLGCGSGILGIAALLEGTSSVAAADTDPLAVRATRDNAVVSGFAEQLQVDLGSIERLAEMLEGRPADLLLCNILAPVIEALCPAFDTVLSPEGLGFLSGLLVSQAPRLQEVLAEQGWSAELTAQQSQWGLMTIRRS